MTEVAELLRIMAKLRDPDGGCPWDLEQDFSTIAPYTIEEAYEVADAIDRGDMHDLKDELGDLLLQVVFHAQMASEAGHFGFDDVVAAICDKMVRRHPHVFPAGDGDAARVENAEAQTLAWEETKRRERETKNGGDHSALAGIARGLPEWQRAVKLQKRAAAVGFDWPDVNPVFDKLHEELDEVREELARGTGHAALEDEIGDVLFVCANLSRHAKVDFGAALRRANQKFERRFRRMEALAAADGVSLAVLTLAQQDAYWDRAKAEERVADKAP
ncbi:nucleoside triphosphate pyrophosphohydrolase [Arenimonas sp.]|uniref:nucleoside triphosphate pyrophosphohydrolase n=1 Tax=Arenimonas sp. TaxID=1872635 RepID=UPI0039E2512E